MRSKLLKFKMKWRSITKDSNQIQRTIREYFLTFLENYRDEPDVILFEEGISYSHRENLGVVGVQNENVKPILEHFNTSNLGQKASTDMLKGNLTAF